jgi:urease accessory protein
VVLVQTVAGPLAGDRTTVEIEVGDRAALEIGTNAATLAFPAGSPARHDVRIRLGAGARVMWRPEPLILAAGCNLEASLRLELAEGAAALTREVVVLGRHGERPGRYRAHLRCELAGTPLLHESVEIDAAGRAQSSPAILAGTRAFGSLALLGVGPVGPADGATLWLEGPGAVRRVLGPDTAALAGALAPVEAAWEARLTQTALTVAEP